MTVGQIIYNRRKALGLTLEEVGKYVGVGKSTVKKWESGYIANMRQDKIVLLAEVLQINPVSLITGEIIFDIPRLPDRLTEKYALLDSEDRATIDGLIDTLLSKDKYKKDSGTNAG